MPDRLVMLPGGWFGVEVKTSTGLLSSMQLRLRRELTDLSFLVAVVNCREAVDDLLNVPRE
ncbi:hypothetical protein CCP3SC5AM1_680001 [Gammaproteobacteria bacterium]